MFCRCRKVTSFNSNSTFSTNRVQKQVTTTLFTVYVCSLPQFKSPSCHHLFILNFLSFFSPPIFSPTLKQNTSTLGNGFREKKNSVSSPVQRKNGGKISLLQFSMTLLFKSKVKVCLFLFLACCVLSLDFKFFGIELWFLNWKLHGDKWVMCICLKQFFLQKESPCFVLIILQYFNSKIENYDIFSYRVPFAL